MKRFQILIVPTFKFAIQFQQYLPIPKAWRMNTSNTGAEPGVSSTETQNLETTEHEEGVEIEEKEIIRAKKDNENHTLKGKHFAMICNLEDSNIQVYLCFTSCLIHV